MWWARVIKFKQSYFKTVSSHPTSQIIKLLYPIANIITVTNTYKNKAITDKTKTVTLKNATVNNKTRL